MTSCQKYNYWEADNKSLIIKDEVLPSWVATLNGLESLHTALLKHYPELLDLKEDKDGEEG